MVLGHEGLQGPDRTLGLGGRLHPGSSLGPVPYNLGVSDPLASCGGSHHHTVSVGDPAGA